MVVVELRKDEKGVSQFGLSDSDALATFASSRSWNWHCVNQKLRCNRDLSGTTTVSEFGKGCEDGSLLLLHL